MHRLRISKELQGQWSGFWLDPGRKLGPLPPATGPTGATLRRLGEERIDEFVCLDLVRVETRDGLEWIPLSEAGCYTYAHSLGLLAKEPWQLVIWNGTAVSVYDAGYADLLAPELIALLYGAEAQGRARPDRLAVQLRLRVSG